MDFTCKLYIYLFIYENVHTILGYYLHYVSQILFITHDYITVQILFVGKHLVNNTYFIYLL